MLSDHRFIRVRRTWIDVSCRASRKDGILLYRPGRKWLCFVPWLMARFSWIPWPSSASWSNILPGFDVDRALDRRVKYATIYIGNGSARSKFTLLVRLLDDSQVIVKVGNSDGAKSAIKHEYKALEKLQTSVLKEQTPKPMGWGECGAWSWSAQSVLPMGSSPTKMQREHFAFLEALKQMGMTHGDFTPWNCAIVGGKLVAWDWEDAGPWAENKDANWFVSQVKTLLGQ